MPEDAAPQSPPDAPERAAQRFVAPLGSDAPWRHERPALLERLTWAGVAIVAATALVMAFRLTPDPSGHGTHVQLGLEPCGMVKILNMPCPSCGMTTSWAWMAHGRPFKAVATQPFGALLFCAAVASVPLSLYVNFWRRSAFAWLNHPWGFKIAASLLVLFAGSWIYKIATF